MSIIANQGLRDLLKCFPEGMSYAFAYGSGVFAQSGQEMGKMTDLVFVVDDPLEWHMQNVKMNWRHYSLLKLLGARRIANIQENMACGVYYNPYCTVNDRLVKYGVISSKALDKDLNQWRHLYIAGRLHKPVADLLPPTNRKLADDLRKNRLTALRAALLQGGRSFSKFELFHNIARLSYIGDTRMFLGENPKKTRNIVWPLMTEFERIYLPLFYEIPFAAIMADGTIIQDISSSARYQHLIALPVPLQISMVRAFLKDPRQVDVEEVLADISHLPNPGLYLRDAIKEVVRGSSIRQTAQGILSAGVRKSIRYAFEKVRKRFQKKPETMPVPPIHALSQTAYGLGKSIPNVEEVLTRPLYVEENGGDNQTQNANTASPALVPVNEDNTNSSLVPHEEVGSLENEKDKPVESQPVHYLKNPLVPVSSQNTEGEEEPGSEDTAGSRSVDYSEEVESLDLSGKEHGTKNNEDASSTLASGESNETDLANDQVESEVDELAKKDRK